MKLLKSVFTSPVGQFTLLGLIVLGVAFGAKLYYDHISVPVSTVAGAKVEQTLEDAVDTLKAHLEGKPQEQAVYPKRAGWTPAVITCGAPVTVTKEEASHPTWALLGLKFAEPVHYQFLFYTEGAKFVLVARADFDCDGLHQVVRLEGEQGYTGLSVASLTVENPDE